MTDQDHGSHRCEEREVEESDDDNQTNEENQIPVGTMHGVFSRSVNGSRSESYVEHLLPEKRLDPLCAWEGRCNKPDQNDRGEGVEPVLRISLKNACLRRYKTNH